jgi:hypothetical protein
MITSKITTDTSYAELSQLTKSSNAPSKAAGSMYKDSVPVTRHTEFIKIDKSHFELFNSQPAYSKMNLVAATVRGADKAMHKIENQIDQMKAQLLEHVKHYPPFGKGSAERVKLMKLFSTLRKQIDQLTIPADNYGAMKIMSDPSRTRDAGDWEIDVADNSGHQVTLHSQQVHSGPAGLNIPELPGEPSDEDLHGAIVNLESAKTILSQRQDKLASDFQNVLDQTRMWQ